MPAVSNTDITRFPYSAVGYIYAVWSNGTGRGGVASVIGKNDVITALTNVYKPDLGWASEINFYFGADYNVASNRFDNTPYSLTSGFRWSATGYNSQLFIDSDNETFLQSETQYNVAIIGLSEEIGLKTGWFGLDPGRDSNGQTFSAVGFSGTDGMVNTVTTVDKSTFAGVYTSATNPFGGKNDIGQGSPIFSAEGYLVGIKATTNWWADIGFLYSFITAELEVNNKLLIASKDTIAPTLVSVSPSNNATRVAVNTNLTITFSEAIERGNGLLLLKDGSGKVIEAFDVRSSSRLTVSGSTIVINPVNDLFYSTQYQLEIPKDAIKDLAGNSYLGLQAYNFTTVWITPTVSIEDATSVEGDDGVKTINFKISLSNAIPIDINLEARTLAGTASTASGDYNGFSTRLITIPAGRLTFDLAVEINGDKKFEPNEGFSVEILNATSANLGDAYARGWIIDDDEPYRLPTDTSARYQWHLYPEVGANIFPVWRDWNGTGIKVAIFDQGIDPTHPDLNDNLLLSLGRKASNLSVGGDPILSIDNHGTPVAGAIAAESNGLGVIGVAPKASLVSIYSPLSSSPASFSAEIVNAFTYAKAFDILNNSWGFGNYSSLGSSYPWAFLDNFRSTTFSKAGQALKSLAENGRNGLGTVVVQSAGNSYSLGDDTNLHNFQNSRYIITVAGTDYQGTATSYSSPGSSVLIAAPGGEVNINNDQLSKIFTTDRVGLAGYGSGDYTFISGTSFSGPIVSGVVALMLDANPLLGYRDVQQIIAYSGRRIAESENTWAYNGAKNWNGGGLHFDSVTHNLGFGLIDTLTAVRLAETWTSPALTSANDLEVSLTRSTPQAIPDKTAAGSGVITQSLSVTQAIVVERVEVTIDILHTWIGDLAILLTSPAGTSSWLLWQPGQSAASPYGQSQDNINFTFNTVLSMGESSIGTWTLSVFDREVGSVGTLNSWTLNLIGKPISDNDVYVYTDEFSESVAAQNFRATLSDTAGLDWINASAVTSSVVLDLRSGSQSTIDGRTLSISVGTVIESAVSGDGNDSILGNQADNYLRGMRGDDSLYGDDGVDTLEGGLGNDALDGGDGVEDVAVFSGASSGYLISPNGADFIIQDNNTIDGNDGTDMLRNIELVTFSDKAINLTGTEFGAPTVGLSSNKASIKAGETATITFTLSKPSTDFLLSDVTVSGGTLTNFTGSGTSYTATFSPTANSTANGVVSVASGKFSDAAGNFNADGADANNTVTMSVDTRLQTIQFASMTSAANEGNSGTSTVTVQATLSAASTQTVTVPITYSGTATSGSDYNNASSMITIAAGQTTGSASFSVVGDTTSESNETVVLTLGTPTNATLGANATFTHTIVNDDTALQPAQPTGVYLPQSSSVALDSALLNVYGASEQESVVLAAGASQVELDQNVDRVYLSNSASAYRYQQTGNRINVYAGSEIVLRIPIQSDDDGTVFVFRDGTASALLQSGVMRLGGAVVASAAPASLSPTLGAVVAAPAGPSTASVYLGEHASFAAASAGLNVYGGNGNETLLMREGASAIVADQGIEAVSFGSGLGRYSFQQTGNRLNVYDQAGTLRLLTVPLQGDDDGTQVAFGGVSYSATLSAGVMRIGSWVVASDAPRAITPEIRVSGAGSGNAASADVRFVFSAGSYNYSIVGFGRGDVLDFPDAANPTVNNNSFTDGTVELQWASAGQVIRVTLTGLSATQDQNLNSLTDLTTLFGPGTVI